MHDPDDHTGPFRFEQPDWAALGVHPSELLGDASNANTVAPLSIRWDRLPDNDLVWVAFEIIDADGLPFSAERWWSLFGDAIVIAGVQSGGQDFSLHTRSWGLVFDMAFMSDADADVFRTHPALRAAIDQLGDLRVVRSSGPGGGGAGARSRRRPRPFLGSGAVEAPLPLLEPSFELCAVRYVP